MLRLLLAAVWFLLFAAFVTWALWPRTQTQHKGETLSAPVPASPAWESDYRLQAIHLAVEFYNGRNADEHMVLRAADEFYARLTRNRSVPPRVADEILTILLNIDRKLDIMSEQQLSVDAAVAALTAITGDVATNVTQLVTIDIPALQAAIAALPASVDTTALDAAVAGAADTVSSLDGAVAGVTALTTPPVEPPPAEPPVV